MSFRRGSCDFGEFQCQDGSCFPYRQGYKCREDECPDQQRACNSQIQCYWKAYDVCDGDNDCKDGTDEIGCTVTAKSSHSSTVLVAVLPMVCIFAFIIIIIILVVVLARRRREAQRNANAIHVVNLQPHPGPGNQALNVTLPQATYYAPGAYPPQTQFAPSAYQQHGPPPASYQPMPRPQGPSAPPPYQEATYYPQK